eukprot:507222-Pelagomonas_calceolata.AAC.7
MEEGTQTASKDLRAAKKGMQKTGRAWEGGQNGALERGWRVSVPDLVAHEEGLSPMGQVHGQGPGQRWEDLQCPSIFCAALKAQFAERLEHIAIEIASMPMHNNTNTSDPAPLCILLKATSTKSISNTHTHTMYGSSTIPRARHRRACAACVRAGSASREARGWPSALRLTRAYWSTAPS